MIPLPNVPGKILSKVIEYCKFHVDAQKTVDNKPAKTEDEVKQWDTEFVKVDQATLFDLILVSHARKLLSCTGNVSTHFLSWVPTTLLSWALQQQHPACASWWMPAQCGPTHPIGRHVVCGGGPGCRNCGQGPAFHPLAGS